MADDLWPTNIADANLLTPVTILKEQAALLGEKTRQLVTGEVATPATGNLFVHHFYIVAPTLNYKYELFSISHGVSFYPTTLRHSSNPVQITSEGALKDNLKHIF